LKIVTHDKEDFGDEKNATAIKTTLEVFKIAKTKNFGCSTCLVATGKV
jgi:hypothetical protein